MALKFHRIEKAAFAIAKLLSRSLYAPVVKQ